MPPIVHGPASRLTRLFVRYRAALVEMEEAYEDGAELGWPREASGRHDKAVADWTRLRDYVDEELRGRAFALVRIGDDVYRLSAPIQGADLTPVPEPAPPLYRLVAPRNYDPESRPVPIAMLANATFVAAAAAVCELKPEPPPIVRWGCA